MAKSIYFSPYRPQAISKQNANSAGWPDPYAPQKKSIQRKASIFVECPICKINVKRLQRHLNRVHKEKKVV